MRRNIKIKSKRKIGVKVGVVIILTILAITNPFKRNVGTTSESIPTPNVESVNVTSHQIAFQGLSQATIPTGCESVSTVAILNHLGIEITPEHFIEEFLPKQSFYRSNGNVYGPDPNEYFAGDPFQKSSLGCFPNVIIKALNAMKITEYPSTENMKVQNLTGTPLSLLTESYISNDIPVLIWVTIRMKESKEGMTYLLEDGTPYTWRSQEHCVVLCGYDEEKYYIMDPLAEGEIVGYSRELVERRYDEMNKSAVAISLN